MDRLKTEFVSIVSHELRTPLTSIKGALQLLIDERIASDPDHALLLNVTLSNTERLVRIINDILDISKIEAGKLELEVRPHTVREVVKQSLQNVESIARGAPVTLEADIEAGVPSVQVDLDRIIQVVVNLLSNALKVAPPYWQAKSFYETSLPLFSLCDDGGKSLGKEVLRELIPLPLFFKKFGERNRL